LNQFVDYIDNVLHIKTNIDDFKSLNELPLFLRNSHFISETTINDVKFLLVYPKEQTNLTALRKQIKQIQKITGLNSVLCLNKIGVYTKDKMLAEGIPFIVPGMQVYLPFLGVVLSKNAEREIPDVDKISFNSQKLLLTAIYKKWTHVTLKEVAEELSLSKMSISRCFNEIQSLGLGCIKSTGKNRYFSLSKNHHDLWGKIVPYLRNPVKQQYRLASILRIPEAKIGGISALSHYSMLADDSCKVLSISKTNTKSIEINDLHIAPHNETPEMIIQVMQYDIDYGDNTAIDPLTAILSISEYDKTDPRIESAINEILESCLND